jgi:hypothetical protein
MPTRITSRLVSGMLVSEDRPSSEPGPRDGESHEHYPALIRNGTEYGILSVTT